MSSINAMGMRGPGPPATDAESLTSTSTYSPSRLAETSTLSTKINKFHQYKLYEASITYVFAISAAAAPVVTDQFGTVRTSFAPGDAVYIFFPEPGTTQIKIMDVTTGAVVLEKTIDVKTPARSSSGNSTSTRPRGHTEFT
jgi:hypothetical protein